MLINASAIGWYGRQGDEPLDEQCQTPHDEFTHQLCQQWETLAREARSKHTRVCIVRIGLVLGTDGGALPKMLPPYRVGLGGPMGTGHQIMSWIHIQDLVRAILFLLEHDECDGLFNGTAPQPVSNREFSQTLAGTLHRPHLFFVPAPAAVADGRSRAAAHRPEGAADPSAAGRLPLHLPGAAPGPANLLSTPR